MDSRIIDINNQIIALLLKNGFVLQQQQYFQKGVFYFYEGDLDKYSSLEEFVKELKVEAFINW